MLQAIKMIIALLTNPLLSDTFSICRFCVCSSGKGTVMGTNVPQGGILVDQLLLSTCVSSSRLDLLMIVAFCAIEKTAALTDSSTDQAQQRQSNSCRSNQSSSDERWMRRHQKDRWG
jgi:hypothetical protein